MAQGKLKTKSKLPENAKTKGNRQKKKGQAFTRRSNAPIQPKKNKFMEQQKIKQTISKMVNKSAEDDIRALATEGNINLSNAQQAVAKHHKAMSETVSSTSTST